MIVTTEKFTEVYELHKNHVYAIAFSYMKNAEDAMDITQDTFIKLLGSSEDFQSSEHVKAWLLRVAINNCKNALRSKKHIADEEVSEEIPYEDKTESMELLKHVNALPEKYRIPIHLFYYEEYSVKEIAQIMDITETNIKVRLKRGREKLSSILVKEDWDV